MKQFLIIFLIVIFNSACKHKPNFNSMSTVSFSNNIQPIIISNCTQSGCHGSVATEKFKLLSYEDLIKYSDIKAGSPETSKLYSVIRSYNPEKIMPKKPFDALTEKQIQQIYVWIGQGALNN